MIFISHLFIQIVLPLGFTNERLHFLVSVFIYISIIQIHNNSYLQ